MRQQVFQRAVFHQPFGRCLRADFRNTGYVIHRVTDQRLIVDHQVGGNPKLGGHAGYIATLAIHRVDHCDARIHQLAQVFVTA